VAETRFDPHVWGWIKKNNGTTVVYDQTGGDFNPNVSQDDGAGYKKRAYFSFDTSAIPAGATIDSAVLAFKFSIVAEPVGFSGTWQFSFYYDHDRIGSTLSADDWGFPDLAGTKSWPSTPSTWVEYEATLVVASVNKNGDTDIEARCTGAYTDPEGPVQWRFVARRSPPIVHHVYLTVTYTVPAGLFNRWNWKLPALPGFSSVIGTVVLASGDLQVVERFYPRTVEA